jgi:hypothetical protein
MIELFSDNARSIPRSKYDIGVCDGPGTASCGAWLDTRDHVSRFDRESWVMGYITAYNRFALSADEDVAKGVDAKGMFAWIDSFCANHPLEDVESASFALVLELRRRNGSR